MTLFKKLIPLALMLCCAFSFAQNLQAPGDVYASQYGQWSARMAVGSPTGTGSQTYIMQVANAPVINGSRLVQPFAINAPLNIQDGNQETSLTPSAVSGCGLVNQIYTCLVTITVAKQHGQGSLVTSGTLGLQECMNDRSQAAGQRGTVDTPIAGRCIADPLWAQLGGTTAMLQAAIFKLDTVAMPNPVVVEDTRNGVSYWYGAPGPTRIATPTALTKAGGAAATLTTAVTGGTIATATTPRITITAVDQFGAETAAADDSSANTALVDGAGSTNSYTITALGVPTGTGVAGYRVYVSATGGTTQTETLEPAANLVCAAAPLSPLPGTCGAGAAILITALPATTAAGPPQGTAGAATALSSAHTTVVAKQSGYLPTMLPFNDTMGVSAFPVTVTSATTLVAGFDVMGEIAYPAGFFNTVGTWQICGGGVATPSAATVAGTWAIRIGPRENSAATSGEVVVVPIGMVASRQWTAVLTHFDFCTDVSTTTTGATGVMEGSATAFGVAVAAGDDGAGVDTAIGAFNAASTAFDLTQPGVIQLSYVQTAASWTLPQLRYFSIRRK